ncbi:16S rRNA (uracil(1498)-N(3))-methyltransferase [Rhabdochromatium marinum]|uniref:16S rRNA (uracil(1498)-N(3))-methyltransferase n=1 Tax=Rhabdochromatium marinum TaxID=48729 RepID=UPI0019065227|nr:16S rRNA (uracil(1498)-N(3))-methyltransferase [Rhabdochromatium marinum]MBK1649361.1 16S rRNA (uracil(1498)-N(3))-methyltransferase [Rhabdochromatium marinum]
MNPIPERPEHQGRRIRVFTDEPLAGDREVTLESTTAKYLLKVLRLRAGDNFWLCDGQGRDFPAQIQRTQGTHLIARLGPPGDLEPPPTLHIRLGLGVSKGERMDFAIQKAIELGVARITPLWTQRSVVRLDGERLARRLTHWRGVITAACEQSGRRWMPELQPASALTPWLAAGQPQGLLLHHGAASGLDQLPPPRDGLLTLLIGPEGGLAPDERRQASDHGFTAVRLGPRILRTETAPLAAIAAAQILWGDFRSHAAASDQQASA